MVNNVTRIAGQNFYSDELYHHGVLGMKWGRHIFGKRNKTTGGKKGSTKSKVAPFVTDAAIDSNGNYVNGPLKGQKAPKSNITIHNNKPKTKSVKDMSDDELNKAIARLRNEQTYKELLNPTPKNNNNQQQNNQSQKKEDSTAKKYAKQAGDAAFNAVKNAGQAYIEKKIKDKLGLNTMSEHDRLKEQSDIATYKSNIARQKAAEAAAEAEAKKAQQAKVNDFMKQYYQQAANNQMLALPGPGAGNTHHKYK